jgi:hypothetical protein
LTTSVHPLTPTPLSYSPGHYESVRLAAYEALADLATHHSDDLDKLLTLLESEPVPVVRHRVTQMLIRRPPRRFAEPLLPRIAAWVM